MRDDIIGKKFGRLTVLERTNRKCGKVNYYNCMCECGNKKEILKNHLISGHTQSCGCLSKEKSQEKRRNMGVPNLIEEKDEYIVVKIISKGKVFDCLIDKNDYEKIKEIRWSICNEYAYNKTFGFLHRYITNCDDNMTVDHINHDKLDNRKCNIRICSNQQNNWNKKSKGYYWNKRNKNWNAEIRINNKKIFLGAFNDEELAKQVRRDAEKKYFKDFMYKGGD